MKLDDAINSRRSIRSFSKKKVRWDYILEAIDASLKAPFAGNINHMQYIIVENQESKNIIAEACQQDWIADASSIVVIISNMQNLKIMYHEHAEEYSQMQTGAAIENFLLKIADLKLASCWVGAFIEEKIKSLLDIKETFKVEAILPIGYPTIKKTKMPRKEPLEKVIHWEKFNQRKKPTPFKDPKTW